MKRELSALGTSFALFTGVVFVSGLSGSGGRSLNGNRSVACNTDGVLVTYQDPDFDGDYEQAVVSDIDCPGKHTTTVRILDSGGNTLAFGQKKTSGPVNVVPFSNVLLESEIEPAGRVRVTMVRTY